MTIRPTVAVGGASRDRGKFGNISVRVHLQQGYEVFPVNPHADEVEGLPAFESLSDVPADNLDRVSHRSLQHCRSWCLAARRLTNPSDVCVNYGGLNGESGRAACKTTAARRIRYSGQVQATHVSLITRRSVREIRLARY